MSKLCEGDELSLAHLPFSIFHQSALFWDKHIIRINHSAGLNSAVANATRPQPVLRDYLKPRPTPPGS